jgi:hypothetical protein
VSTSSGAYLDKEKKSSIYSFRVLPSYLSMQNSSFFRFIMPVEM